MKIICNLSVHTYLLGFAMVLQHQFPLNHSQMTTVGGRRDDAVRLTDSAAKTSEESRQLDS